MRFSNTVASSSIAIAFLLATCAAMSEPGKLDAGMRRHLEEQASPPAHDPRARSVGTTAQEMIDATVNFSGDGLAEMRALGVTVRSVLGDVATVQIPAARLAEVAALTGVIRIEKPTKPVGRLDRSVPATKADQLRSGTTPATWVGGTGKGVIIGVIDSGLDLAHMDFLKVDGTSRVLSFWNQRTDAVGTPPTGADGTTALYGALCTQEMINAALKGTANNCRVEDTGGHGTHVAGIAAGTGQATGNGQASYRFVGVAPEADLMIANSIDKGASAGDPVLDAISYMARQAKALGRPIVINLSLGSYFGPRDGTSNYEKGMDGVSGPGVILVGAAGNEGDAKIRAIRTIAQGETVNLGFKVPADATSEQLEIWYNGANKFDVMVGCGTDSTPMILAGDSSYAKDTACGKISVMSTEPSATNGDRQILVKLEKGTSALKAGDWTLTVKGTVVGADNRLSVISGETAQSINFTTNTEAITNEILTDTVSARRVIAVAAYNTRSQWTNAAGAHDAGTGNGALGDIGVFSSRGPRRMCSDTAKCPAAMKPEITAPGAHIMAAYTSKPAKAEAASDIEADGVHVAYVGTSMAAPHVAGLVALLLQAKPDLTPEDVKRILATTVQGNASTAAVTLPAYTGVDLPPSPNYTWGYGIVDAARALRSLAGGVLAVNGWHLLGNTLATPIDVASVFADKTTVTTVWKWNAAGNSWAFFAPSLDAAALAAYAAGKGYTVLATIQPGEGFWVNLTAAATLPLRGGPAMTLDASVLPAGWNLVATGTETTPAAVNTSLTAKQLTAFTTLWAWDNANSNWYFYAPTLDASGGLAAYIAGKGYRDFTAAGKKLGHGVGFWVNR